MGRTSVVICEFNPFHFGHLRLIEEAKREEGDRIICIMSGNFVQRGEIAVADRFTRADAALRCGADVVLELPVPFSFGSAEYFADAAVRIADGLGIAD